MKPIKRIIAVFIFLTIALSLSACKDNEAASVFGKWSVNEDGLLQMTGLTKEEYDQFVQMGVEQTVIMDFGGKGEGIVAITMSVSGQYVEDYLPYEVKDGKIYISGDPADYEIKGNIMTITQDDIKMTLTKVETEN